MTNVFLVVTRSIDCFGNYPEKIVCACSTNELARKKRDELIDSGKYAGVDIKVIPFVSDTF